MVSSLYADTNGGYAGAFLRMGLGAEAMAQGDAMVARTSSGFAGYYNAAGLADIKNRTFATSYSHLALDRQLNYVGICFPLKPTAGLSLSWINAGVTGIDGRDYDGNHYGWLSYHENSFNFAFANKFSPYVSAGVGVKVLYGLFPEMLDDDKAIKATGVAFDVGVMIKPHDMFQVGLQVRDINGKYGWDSSEFYSEGTTKNDKFPRIYKVGVAVFPTGDLSAEYDIELSDKDAIEHHFGLEYAVLYKDDYAFKMRTGYDHDVPTFGFGFSFPMWDVVSTLDMAYIIEDVAPNDTMIFSWSVLF